MEFAKGKRPTHSCRIAYDSTKNRFVELVRVLKVIEGDINAL